MRFLLGLIFTLSFLAQADVVINDQFDVAGATLPDQTGNSGKFLSTDGTSASWNSVGGGGGTPGGGNADVQFNDSSAFGGSSYFTWANGPKTLTIKAPSSNPLPLVITDDTDGTGNRGIAFRDGNYPTSLANIVLTGGSGGGVFSGANTWEFIFGTTNGAFPFGSTAWYTSNQRIFSVNGQTPEFTVSKAINALSFLDMQSQNILRFYDADDTNYVAFKAGDPIASNVTWTLPLADGDADQFLQTDGAGNLSWADAAGGGGGANTALSNLIATNVNETLNMAATKTVVLKNNVALIGRNAGDTGNVPLIKADGADGSLTIGDNDGGYSFIQVSDGFMNIATQTGAAIAGNIDINTPAINFYGDSVGGTPVDMIFWAGDQNETATVKAPLTLAASYTLTLPPNDGTASQFLQTDGVGVLTWASAATASGVSGSVQFSNGSGGLSSDAANLFWDDTNNRLGIGTNAPGYTLDVVGGNIKLDEGAALIGKNNLNNDRELIKSSGTGQIIVGDGGSSFAYIELNDAYASISVEDENGLVSGGLDLIADNVNIFGAGVAAPTLSFSNNDGGFTAGVRAPGALAANYLLTLPLNDGDASQFLQTNGSGVLTWASAMSASNIGARAHNSATTITGTLATIVWTTEDYDTNAALATGVFTCPVAGKYQVNTALALSGAFILNTTTVLEIQKNGTAWANKTHYIAAAITNEHVQLSDIVDCAASDTIRIQASNSGTGPAIVSSDTRNFLSISFMGN